MTERPTLTFGDDGSAGADTAARWIGAQAWPGWQLHIVTAQEPVPGTPRTPGDGRLQPWEPPEPRRLPAEAGFTAVTHLTAHVDPRVALMASTDLLVVGPRGPGLLKALHLGSTAEWLLEHPPAPLVIAREDRPAQRVLVCPDGSPHALAAASAFARLPWADQAEALVLVVEDGRSDHAGAEAAVGVLADAGVTVRRLTATGKPAPAISAAVAEHQVDLVVLGTRGLTGLHRLRVGSTAGAVARSVPCPVLLACAEEADAPAARPSRSPPRGAPAPTVGSVPPVTPRHPREQT